MSVRFPYAVARAVVFPVWGRLSSLLFRVGLRLCRFASGSPSFSFGEGRLGWSSLAVGPALDSSALRGDYERDREFLRQLVWFLAKPSAPGAEGDVPASQMAVLDLLLSSRWSGGKERSAALLALVREVMAEEGLIIR